MKFHPDPNNPKEMICDDCFQALEEIKSDWMDEDDGYYLWDDDNEYEDQEDDDDE